MEDREEVDPPNPKGDERAADAVQNIVQKIPGSRLSQDPVVEAGIGLAGLSVSTVLGTGPTDSSALVISSTGPAGLSVPSAPTPPPSAASFPDQILSLPCAQHYKKKPLP